MGSVIGAGPQGVTAPAGWRRALGALDRGIGVLAEGTAALLILVECVILFVGVVARYVFHAPLIWADEAASILFLWLAMIGSVVALRRHAHMRLTVLANRRSAAWREWLELVAIWTMALFLILILHPTLDYIEDEALVMTPALGLSATWRTASMLVGFGLMIAVVAMRLLEGRSWVLSLSALAFVAAIAGVLLLAQPFLMKLGNYNLLIFFVGIVAIGVILGVPIAFAFGVATLGYLALTTHVPLSVVVSRMQDGMAHLVLLSVPLFVLLGLLIEMTGMARAMVDFLVSLLGHVRSGLAYVLLGAIYLVSGISGSKAADMAAVAPVLFPEMKKRGYKDGELVSMLSASAAMSETIPPSLVLITIGSVTDVSIAALFTGGLLPALVLAVALGVLARFRARNEDLSQVPRASRKTILRTLAIALPALALPFIIRSAVVEGVATATEVSTIGIAYTLICGIFVYRCFDWRRVYPMLVETASLTGAILLIIGAATAMAWGLTQSGFSRAMIALVADMPGGKAGFLVASIIAFVILGSLLEGIPALVLFAPLLFPLARAVGVHEVHYAMVVILAMGIGLFAPPVGVGYYTACAIGRVDPAAGMRAIWPYMGALLVALIAVAAFPWLSIGFL